MTAGYSFELWGGRADVRVCDPRTLDDAVAEVRATINEIDDACSPYRADSEITVINDSPATTHRVSPGLLAALRVAVLAAEATDGLTDPTVGSVTLPSRGPITGRASIRVVPGGPRTSGRWNEIVMDPTAGTVTVPAGVRLDLGATAKAWCADLAAQRAAATIECGVLVNLLGDIATAGTAPSGGWDVLVADDHRWTGAERQEQEEPGARVSIDTGALATSSTTVRRRHVAGAPPGSAAHVVDPRNQRAVAGPYRTVSVAAATCAEANAAATASLVRGAGAARWLAAARLPARLVRCDGGVELVGGWPR